MTAALIIVGGFIAFMVMAAIADAADHPAPRCRHCGRKFGPDHIPPHIREMTRAAGLKGGPDWYVGPLICPHYKPKKTLADLASIAAERGDEPDPAETTNRYPTREDA